MTWAREITPPYGRDGDRPYLSQDEPAQTAEVFQGTSEYSSILRGSAYGIIPGKGILFPKRAVALIFFTISSFGAASFSGLFGIKFIIMEFPYVHICAILSDDRINDGAVKVLITKEVQERDVVDSGGLKEAAA